MADMSTQAINYVKRNVAERLEEHRHVIRIFYKNLTESWQHPIRFPLDHVHVATGIRDQGIHRSLPNNAKM